MSEKNQSLFLPIQPLFSENICLGSTVAKFTIRDTMNTQTTKAGNTN